MLVRMIVGDECMIKNLSGEYETVEYENQRFVMLYNNTQTERYPVHWHNAIEMIMPLENDFIVQTCGKEFCVKEYEMIWIPPGELHTLPPRAGRRIIFQCDNRVLAEAPALEVVRSVLAAPLHITPELDKTLHLRAKKCMLDIYSDYFSGSEVADVKIYVNLISMLVAVREYQMERTRISLDCAKDKMHQYSEKFNVVLKYIDKNYMYDITLDQLAEIAGYSKYHFSRIFKEFNSMSYLQYINLRRTRAAEALLLDASIPITEVAMRSGFSSLTTFNRIFKEIKHCTPSDYKRFYSTTEETVFAPKA